MPTLSSAFMFVFIMMLAAATLPLQYIAHRLQFRGITPCQFDLMDLQEQENVFLVTTKE